MKIQEHLLSRLNWRLRSRVSALLAKPVAWDASRFDLGGRGPYLEFCSDEMGGTVDPDAVRFFRGLDGTMVREGFRNAAYTIQMSDQPSTWQHVRTKGELT